LHNLFSNKSYLGFDLKHLTMTPFTKTIFTVTFFLISTNLLAQDCSVAVEALKGKYEGECKNGKAEGVGKATGTDTYEGHFKSGLPNGEGKYIWKNGNSYHGNWNKGNREGYGEMTFKTSGTDSVVTGYWKKDVYKGKYENPYVILRRSEHMSSISVRKQEGSSSIDLNIESEAGGNVQSNSFSNTPTLTDLLVEEGNYIKRSVNTSGKRTNYFFEDVTFPFKAIFTMGNDQVELELYEAGKWVVEFKLHL